MSYTVGFRLKERVAKRLRVEWSKQWSYTSMHSTKEEAEEKRQEWLRNPANRELDFKVIELLEITHTGDGEIHGTTYIPSEEAHEEKTWTFDATPCSDPRCLR